MNEAAHLSLLIYGILLILGGVAGFAKARSKPSLIAGAGSGIAALALWYARGQGWTLAPHFALALAVVLLLMMGRRFAATKKFMPAGLIAILSLIVAALQIAVIAT